jgi:thioredoxin-like negative regulator of GroEL
MIKLQTNNLSQYFTEYSKGLILIFGSPECPKCVDLLNKIDDDPLKFPTIYIDGDKFDKIADKFNILFYPTLILIKNSKEIDNISTSDISRIKKWLSKY